MCNNRWLLGLKACFILGPSNSITLTEGVWFFNFKKHGNYPMFRMPSLNFKPILSTLPALSQIRIICLLKVLYEWSLDGPNDSETWRKFLCLNLDNNHYNMCRQCCTYSIFMRTCSWWVVFPSQQPVSMGPCWQTALWLSEPTLSVYMEIQKSLIFIFPCTAPNICPCTGQILHNLCLLSEQL